VLASENTQRLLLIKFFEFFLLAYERLRQTCDQLRTSSIATLAASFQLLLNFVTEVVFYYREVGVPKNEKLLYGLGVGNI
jgi:hypothetical protein